MAVRRMLVGGSRSRTNEYSGGWKGDKASYVAKHQWIYRRLGFPSSCSICGSLGWGKELQWHSESGKYLRTTNDWVSICASCHKRMHYKQKHGDSCTKGHPFSGAYFQIYVDKSGHCHRICLICRYEAHLRRTGRDPWVSGKPGRRPRSYAP